jgi:thymidylate synthase
MAKIDITYHNLLNKILQEGYTYEDPNRKGVNRIEIPSYTFRYEFKDGFPAITTKKLHYKNVVTELIWFLRGDTNIKYLVDNGCNFWNKDAYNYYKKIHNDWERKYLMSFDEFIMCIKFSKKELYEYLDKSGQGFKSENYNLGDLGPVYGKQWRDRNGIDQFKDLIENLKNKPLEARHYLDTWNPEEKHLQALPPCHYGFQVVVRPLKFWERVNLLYKPGAISTSGDLELVEEELNESDIPKYGFELHWNQMSCDTFLGIPANISSYATLALILEKITGYKALAIQGDLKKVHLYNNSLDAVKEQLSRDINKYGKSELSFHGEEGTSLFEHYKSEHRKDITLDVLINSLKPSTFKLEGYDSYPAINVEMLERNE